jgi:hypothetical protein
MFMLQKSMPSKVPVAVTAALLISLKPDAQTEMSVILNEQNKTSVKVLVLRIL